MKTIQRQNMKNQTLAVQTVRALLKKKGFKVGSWGANGRIKGMSEFYGGDIEVKGNEFAWRTEHGVNFAGVPTSQFVVDSNVVVRSHALLGKKENMSDVLKGLKEAGLHTKVEEKSGDIVVDNKEIE